MKLKLKLLLYPPTSDEEEWHDYPCPHCGHAPVPAGICCQECGCPGLVDEEHLEFIITDEVPTWIAYEHS